MGSKIGRCIYLVNRPFIFNLIRLNIRFGECSMFNSMRQLEYDADQETSYNSCDKKSDYPRAHTHHINGKHNKYESMYHFKNPEVKMIHKTHFLQRHFTYAFPEIFIVIEYKNPEYVKHRI